MSRRGRDALAIFCWLAVWAQPAAGHGLNPVVLHGAEGPPGTLRFHWIAGPTATGLSPVFPDDCVASEWGTECPVEALSQLYFDGYDGRAIDVVLRVVDAEGLTTSRIIRPGQRATHALTDYIPLGIEHIVFGWDHLFFVLGLTLLVSNRRTLLVTITAFTVGHSLTLAAVVLGYLSFPPPLAEVWIALSVLLLAVELSRPEAAPSSWTARWPWLVAGTFGLLHGLGFAGALAEIGLPPGDIPAALALFNVGVELGQIGVVVLVWILWRALPSWSARRQVPAYLLGSFSVGWTLERIWPILGP